MIQVAKVTNAGLSNQVVHRLYVYWDHQRKVRPDLIKDVSAKAEAGGFHWTVKVTKADGREMIFTTKSSL